MQVRSYRTELLLAAVAVCVVGIMFLLNDINRQIRIRELRISLQKNSEEDNGLDHIGLVMKYRLHKRLYENRITQDDADIVEMRVNSILAGLTAANKVSMERYEYLSRPSLAVINLFRSIIRKGPIQDMREDKSNVFLEIAYYYERNNYFAKALDIYEKAIREEKQDRSKRAGIHLHRGFCHAILGNYKTARKELLTVINDYGDKPVANTALILLRYLDGFRSELDRILKNDPNTIGKSEKLCRLLAYRDALNVINRIEKTASPADKPRMLYLKGRCLENLSRKETAIDIFQKIVNENDQSNYARLANRRIYISGALAKNGEKIKNLAVSNNRVLKDRLFDRMRLEESRVRRIDDDMQEKNRNLEKEMAGFERRYPVLVVNKIESLGKMVKRSIKRMAAAITPGHAGSPPEIKIKIQTNDGNVFVGVITAETEDELIIKSLFGDVRIPKSKITNRTETK